MPASTNNGKKTIKKLPLPQKAIENQEEEEEEYQEEEIECFETNEGDDQLSGEGSESSEAEEEPTSSLMKKVAAKRKAPKVVAKKTNKKMKNSADTVDDVEGESFNELSSKDRKKKKNPNADVCLDKVDLNLNVQGPENVVNRRIQIASNIFMGCMMVLPDSKNQLTYEYPAIYFQRITKDSKSKDSKKWFTYIPLKLLPQVATGLEFIKKENGSYFS